MIHKDKLLLQKILIYFHKLGGNIMTADYNLTNTESLRQAKSIDFANRFGNNINKLLEILGITNKRPMNVGSNIKIYKYSIERTFES